MNILLFDKKVKVLFSEYPQKKKPIRFGTDGFSSLFPRQIIIIALAVVGAVLGLGGHNAVEFVLVQVLHTVVFVVLLVVVVVPAAFALVHGQSSQMWKRKSPSSKTRQL